MSSQQKDQNHGSRSGTGGDGGNGGGLNQLRNRSAWMWVAVLALLFLPTIINLFTANRKSVTYNEFLQQVSQDNIAEVTISGRRIQGSFNSPVSTDVGDTVSGFTVYVPAMARSDVVDTLTSNGVPIYTRPDQGQGQPSILGILINIAPFALIIWLGYRMFRGMRQRGQSMMDVGRNKAKLYDRQKDTGVTFGDVAGLQSAIEEVSEIVDFLKDAGKYEKVGARTPKGLLLVGPPGTGKTLLARAAAGEANVPFYSMSGSDFMEMFVGVGASRVRNLFKDAKKRQPAIIFIDELDSIGRTRGAGLGGGHDEREQTLNQLLSEMDGFDPQEAVIVLAATNRPDILDPAILRPGRFDRRVTTNLPSVKDRIAILTLHARKRPLADEVDLASVARGTPGFSGADLENLLNEASLLAARNSRKTITMDDITTARDKVILGLKRRNLTITGPERKRIAYHESGHAITAAILPNADPLLKVSIIPRERSMGVTQQIPDEEKYLYTEDYLSDRIAVMLAGRAAEELEFGSFTNGSEQDLKEATRVARKMVRNWGMDKRLGAFSAGSEATNVFLGEELSRGREYSDETAREIDAGIMELLSAAYDRAKSTLEENRTALQSLAEELLQNETLTGEEVGRLVSAV